MTRTAVAIEPFTASNGTAAETLTDSTARWALFDAGNSGFLIVTSNKLDLGFGTGGAVIPMRETAGTYSNDQYAFATIGGLGLFNQYQGIIVRGSGSGGTSTYYEWEIDNSASAGAGSLTTVLRKVVNQAATTLDSRSVTWANGDIMVLEVSGTTLSCYNGTGSSAIFTLSDAAISTGKPGISMRGSGNAHTNTWDDWEGGNLSTASASPPPPRGFDRIRSILQH